MRENAKFYLPIVIAGCLVLLYGLGDFGLWDPWESRHPQAAREMRQAESWTLPRLDGEPRISQTILPYWGIALGSAVVGWNEWGARLPGALAAFACAFAIFHTLSGLRTRRAGLLGAIAFLTMPQVFLLGRQALPDIYLMTTLGASWLAFAAGRRRTSYVLLGAALLAKGPVVAGVLWVTSVLGWGLLRFDGGQRPSPRTILAEGVTCAALVGLVAGPWHVAMLLRADVDWVRGFLLHHNWDRVVDTVGRTADASYYVEALIFAFFPWSCFLPLALFAAIPWWRDGEPGAHSLETLCLTAVVVTLGAFSAAVTKYPHYIAPAAVPLAVLIGTTLDASFEWGRWGRRLRFMAAMLLATALLDLRRGDALARFVAAFCDDRSIPMEVSLGGLFTVGAGLAFGCLLASTFWPSRAWLAGFGTGALLLALFQTVSFVPDLTPHKSMAPLTETWRERNAREAFTFFGRHGEGLLFYTDGAVQRFEDPEAWLDAMAPARPAFAVVESKQVGRLDLRFRQRYGRSLTVVDRSNTGYKLLANFETGG